MGFMSYNVGIRQHKIKGQISFAASSSIHIPSFRLSCMKKHFLISALVFWLRPLSLGAYLIIGTVLNADEIPILCVPSKTAEHYTILSDRIVILTGGDDDIILTLKHECTALKHHGYFSFIPINGQLCVNHPKGGPVNIVHRGGVPCTIGRLHKSP